MIHAGSDIPGLLAAMIDHRDLLPTDIECCKETVSAATSERSRGASGSRGDDDEGQGYPEVQ